ncbi:MAG: methyltransferase [Candidatus Nanoarchaeia archaeon]|nr:methyltransferase [Candidatus Nanoarchaeia archaeon]
MIYEPREDSFLLQEQVRKFATGRVLDVGTGSGLQALAALEKTDDVEACDINLEAVEYVKSKGVKAYQSDLFEKVKGKFDLIVFNPPYLPLDEAEDEESRIVTTGGKKGHEIIERFLKEAKSYLKENGIILIVFSSLSGDVFKVLEEQNYGYEKLSEKKIFFESLYICKLRYGRDLVF